MAAEQYCVGSGGHLVSIQNMFDNVFVSEAATIFTDSASVDFWIGADNLYNPGSWTWMDGTLFDFSDWDKGQPANMSGYNCGAAELQGGQWIADNCFKTKSFVCLNKLTSPPTIQTTTTIKTTTKPKSCSVSWTAHDGFCYKVYENSNWLDAEDRCRLDGAHLASIHSLDEDLFVTHLAYYNGADGCIGESNAWLGLFTEDSQAHWNWTDGTLFDYVNWMPGHPNPPSAHKDCGYILLTSCSSLHVTAGNFDNAPCSMIFPRYICKKLPN
uniref:C-type lectin domain-containing protein n=1 Tax=Panagrolaimus sp. ES5 TaxID=591445 RepID=A0AC34FWL8_9BILA